MKKIMSIVGLAFQAFVIVILSGSVVSQIYRKTPPSFNEIKFAQSMITNDIYGGQYNPVAGTKNESNDMQMYSYESNPFEQLKCSDKDEANNKWKYEKSSLPNWAQYIAETELTYQNNLFLQCNTNYTEDNKWVWIATHGGYCPEEYEASQDDWDGFYSLVKTKLNDKENVDKIYHKLLKFKNKGYQFTSTELVALAYYYMAFPDKADEINASFEDDFMNLHLSVCRIAGILALQKNK